MIDIWRQLMGLLSKAERRRLWLLMGMVIASAIANMFGVAAIIPLVAVLADPQVLETNAWLAWIYEALAFGSAQTFLIALSAVICVAYLMGLAMKALTAAALYRFGALCHRSIALRVLSGYVNRPYDWFLNRHSADLVKTVLNEVSAAVDGILIPALNAIANAAVVLALVLLIVAVNPLGALFMAVLIGGSYLTIFRLLRRRIIFIGRQRFEANATRYRVAQELMTGAKEIKVLGLEESSLRRFAAPNTRYAQAWASHQILGEVPRHVLEGVAFVAMLVVLMLLLAIKQGEVAAVLPIVGVYALAGARLLPAMQTVYHGISSIRFFRPSLESVCVEMSGMADPPPPPPAPTPVHLADRLELRDIGYRYPGAERTALSGLTLDFPAKTTVGIVGGSGAGKTTAMDIMLGLLVPQEGALVVDGHPLVGEAERRGWGTSLGYVPQQIFLVDDSVAANIAFGRPAEEIDHAAVERAARMAQLHAFITEQLPDGYATLVGDRGIRLSGGQRQRIGIARALYHDPDVLILDEATSALDNLTEQAVMEAIQQLGGTKTIVLVAHRLSTVRHCDEIFLLDDGRLVARGTYAELIERSRLFREMAKVA